MRDKIIGEAITFDDVLLVPARSSVVPSKLDLSTRLTRNIELHIPLVTSFCLRKNSRYKRLLRPVAST